MKILAGVLAVWLVACGPAAPKDDRPSQWAGSTPHLRVVGTLDGEKLDIRIEGDDAANTTKLWCQREYEVPAPGGQRDYAKGKLGEIKIRTDATLARDGKSRYAELELKQHNFQKDPAGTSVKVVPRLDTAKPAADSMWFEWEWHAEDKSTLFERAAESGSYQQGEYTGNPDSTGLVIPANTGTTGGFLTVRWSETDELVMSFSTKCTKSDVVEVQ